MYENQIRFRWWVASKKTMKIPVTTIVVRAVFDENNKYPQVFLDEYLWNINEK